MSDTKFEDTVKNLLKMPHKPHKPAKAETDGGDNVPSERVEKKPRSEAD